MEENNGSLGISANIDSDRKGAQQFIADVERMGRTTDDFTGRVNRAERSIEQDMLRMGDSSKELEQVVSNLGKAIGGMFLGMSAEQAIRQIVATRGEFQQLEVAFKTMLGSEQSALDMMSQLTKTAATTPFDLQGVASGAKQLLAYGIQGDKVNDTLVRLGDVAAGLSIPLNDIVYLYGTTITQGRMFTQDLRQFQGRGIPIAEELAKVLGVTKEEVGGLVTAGKVTSEVFIQAFDNMTNVGGKFGGLMNEQSKTITGQISNIEDSIDMMFNDIGKQSEGLINTTLSVVSTLVENWQTVGEAIMVAAETIGIYKAAQVAVAAYEKGAATLSYQAEIAELSKVIPLKEASANADIQEAIAKGQITEAMGAKIIALREEAAAELALLETKAEATAKTLEEAEANVVLSQTTLANKEKELDIAYQTQLQAEEDLSLAIQKQAAAEAHLNQLREEIRLQQELEGSDVITESIADTYEKIDVAATEAAAAAKQAESAAVAEAAAAKAVESAENAVNTATEELNTATRQRSIAATEAETASIAVNTAQETLNTAATVGDTAAKGLWAQTTALADKVQKAFNASMLASPLFWIAATIAGVTYAVYQMATAIKGADAAQQSLDRELEEANKAQKEHNQKVSEAIRLCNDDTAANKDREQALSFLSDKYKDIIKNYIDEEGHLTNIIQLKKEIAAIDGKESIENSKEAYYQSKDYASALSQYKSDLKGNANAQMSKTAREAMEKYREEVGVWGTMGSTTQDAIDFFNKKASGQKEQVRAGYAAEKITTLQENIKNLTVAQLQSRVRQLKAGQKQGTQVQFKNSELEGQYYNQKEVNTLLTMYEGALTQRKNNIPYQTQAANAMKDWKKAKQNYDSILKDQKATVKQVQDAKSEMEKYDLKYEELTGEKASKETTKNDKASAKANKEAEARQKAEDKLRKVLNKDERQRIRTSEDLAIEEEQAKIDILSEGAEKQRRQRELDHKKTMLQIEREAEDRKNAFIEMARQEFESDPARRKDKKVFDVETYLNSEEYKSAATDIDGVANSQKKAATYKIEKQLSDMRLQSLRNYLKEYGSIEEKKAAISEEYNKRIAESESEYEKASLREKMKRELKDIEATDIFEKMDWSNIFGNLESHTKEYLEKLRDQLRELLDSNKLSDVADIEKVQSKLNELNKYISAKGGIFSLGGEYSSQRIELQSNYENAKKGLSTAEGEELNARARLAILKESGASAEKIKVAESELAKAREKTQKAINAVNSAANALSQTLGQKLAGALNSLTDSKLMDNIREIPELLKKVGLGDASEKASSAISGIDNAAGAVSDFASGNYVGAVVKGISAVSDFGDALGLWSDGNASEVNAITEENNKAIKSLTERIDVLKDAIDKNTGVRAADAGASAMEAQEEINRRTMETLQSQMGYWSAHHSNSYYADNAEISKLYAQNVANAKRAGIEMVNSISGLNDLYTMTPEQIAAIKTYMPALWEYLTTVGYYDKSEYWEAVVQQADKLDEITQQINANLTGATFDQLRDSFKSTLEDMNSSSADFAQSFEDMMFKAMVNAFVLDDSFDNWLKEWQQKYADAVKANDKKLLNNLVNEATAKRDELIIKRDTLAENMGYDGGSSNEASATVNSAKSLTEDTGNELVGRITAQQIVTESINVNVRTILSLQQQGAINLESIREQSQKQYECMTECRDIQYESLNVLKQISSDTAHLESISDNISRIRQKTDNL